MKGFIRSFLTASLLALLAWLAPISAMAQAYPSRAVTLINPYPPGGGADVLARALEQGQAVVVFQGADLVRQGRLAQVHALRGGDQLAGVGDGH